MSEAFIGEIRIFPYTFAPQGWALCDGQMLAIGANTALFAVIGTTYGGNGATTFALPNLDGRAAMHPGNGFVLGQMGGAESITLTDAEIPIHVHPVLASTEDAEFKNPGPARVLGRSVGGFAYQTADAPTTDMSPQAIGVAGGGLPHNNMMPYQVLRFCIALVGVFPSPG